MRTLLAWSILLAHLSVSSALTTGTRLDGICALDAVLCAPFFDIAFTCIVHAWCSPLCARARDVFALAHRRSRNAGRLVQTGPLHRADSNVSAGMQMPAPAAAAATSASAAGIAATVAAAVTSRCHLAPEPDPTAEPQSQPPPQP